MKQLNLFEPNDIDLDTPMSNKKPKTKKNQEEALWSIERLESIPFFQHGKIYAYVEELFQEHKREGRDGFAKAIAYEWVVK